VPHLCEFYLGICLTTEEKARKNLSQGKKNLRQVKKNLVLLKIVNTPHKPAGGAALPKHVAVYNCIEQICKKNK
jgi:hypothetical protein